MSEWIETKNGKLCGDVDFNEVEPVAGAITPGSRRSWTYDNSYAYEKYRYGFKKKLEK